MKTIIVLGMHRSFTSGIAKGCASFFPMGSDLIGPGHGNEHGHFEDIDFVQLNDRILAAAGGSWRYPPSTDAIELAAAGIRDEIIGLIERKQAEPLWGWKDPRTTITLPAYLPYLTDPILVPCFRDPRAVAQSLFRRDNIPPPEGLQLATVYNMRMIQHLLDFALIFEEAHA